MNKFSEVTLGLLAIACFFWAAVMAIVCVWVAFDKDPRMWFPITGVLAGLVCAALAKWEGRAG